MTLARRRSLSVGPMRAFSVVSRTLNFRLAADELHLSQSAVSRQIQTLEDEVGVRVLDRDTRGVRLTPAGITLLQALGPWLERVDLAVRQVRLTEGRKVVGISTFSSMASLWLLPRLAQFQQAHALDVRVLSRDQIVAAESHGPARVDAVIRYCRDGEQPDGALRLFDELMAPVASPALMQRALQDKQPLHQPADLARHTWIEDLDLLPSSQHRSWFNWLGAHGQADLQPRHWLYFNLAHQQMEAAGAAHGLAIGRLPMVADRLRRGELVEPFGVGARVSAPYAYWLIVPGSAVQDAEHRLLLAWLRQQAAGTRQALAS